MDKKVRTAVFSALMGVFATSGPAMAIDFVEAEPNNEPKLALPVMSKLQVLTQAGDASVVEQGATITGVAGVKRDVDVFQFHAVNGSRVTISVQADFSSVLQLFKATDDAVRWKLIRESWSTPESAAPVIENADLSTGDWLIVLSPHLMLYGDGGILDGDRSKDNFQSGPYKLVIKPVSTAVVAQRIEIAIKPGSKERTPINPNSKGNIPVALLTSDDFDALKVDMNSLKFGATGGELSFRSCGKGGQDVDGDGRLDLVCHFQTELTEFTAQSSEGVLKGTVVDANGQSKPIFGVAPLKAVPPKELK